MVKKKTYEPSTGKSLESLVRDLFTKKQWGIFVSSNVNLTNADKKRLIGAYR